MIVFISHVCTRCVVVVVAMRRSSRLRINNNYFRLKGFLNWNLPPLTYTYVTHVPKWIKIVYGCKVFALSTTSHVYNVLNVYWNGEASQRVAERVSIYLVFIYLYLLDSLNCATTIFSNRVGADFSIYFSIELMSFVNRKMITNIRESTLSISDENVIKYLFISLY